MRLLTKRGHHVTLVGNGAEAVAALEQAEFDVVLMDVQMPVMSGIEATRAIRSREKATGRHTRIVAMTAHALKGDRERCLAAGMDGYLAKPIDRLELFEVVEQQLEPAPASTRGDRLNTSELHRRCGGDFGAVREAIEGFLEDAPRRLEATEWALAANDARGVETAAHELKGAAGLFGAAGVVDAARALEILGRHGTLDGARAAWQRLHHEVSHLIDDLRALLAESNEETPCAS